MATMGASVIIEQPADLLAAFLIPPSVEEGTQNLITGPKITKVNG